MDIKARIGQYVESSVAGEVYRAYIPNPLPPRPPLQIDAMYHLLDQANMALGRLDGMGNTLPDENLFIYMYVRKEAVLSSQIEGTQSSLSDLLMYENEDVLSAPAQDVIGVSNYVAAMEHGLERLRNGFPLSLRLMKEMHAILLRDGRGSVKQPGEFRRSQNWIGGTRPGNARFVPPPPETIIELLGKLELFLHDDNSRLPTLIKAALAHVQFETIHPFLDGNGRLGRLLITFILCADDLLTKPLLYLSLYFKKHRQLYYDRLQDVRETGDWESWVQFFLEGVIATANQATLTAQTVIALFKEDREKIKELGRPAGSALIVQEYMEQHSIADVRKITESCGMSIPAVTRSLRHLERLQIIKEVTGKERRKIYVYEKYLDVLSNGVGG